MGNENLTGYIEALQWTQDAHGVSSETPFGTYYTFGFVGRNWSVTHGQRHNGKIIISGENDFPEEAAKAAAQADYERRILSALDATERQSQEPCGECHLQPGETCDICGLRTALAARDAGGV